MNFYLYQEDQKLGPYSAERVRKFLTTMLCALSPSVRQITLFLLGFVLFSNVTQGEDWTMPDGTIHKQVKVVKVDTAAQIVTILDEDGGASIPFTNLPSDLQRKYGYDPLKDKKTPEVMNSIAPQALDLKCAKFIHEQIDEKNMIRRLGTFPSTTTVLSNVSPEVLDLHPRIDATYVVYPVRTGDAIQPIGIINGKFIVHIRAKESYSAVDGVNFHGVGFNYSAHVADKTDEITGTGLIPVEQTAYNNGLKDMAVHDLLGRKAGFTHFHLSKPISVPLYLSGKEVGKETLTTGMLLNLKSENGDSLTAFQNNSEVTFSVPKASTDWDDLLPTLEMASKMQGFLDRLNQLLSSLSTRIEYNPTAEKRFTITNAQGQYWAFNPEDLSLSRPQIYNQDESDQYEQCLIYSHLRAIGYADNESAFVAADKTTSAVVTHGQVTRTIFYVTVETQNKEDRLNTSEAGDIQKRQLIFRLEDKAEANEVADLFADFCGTFSTAKTESIVK